MRITSFLLIALAGVPLAVSAPAAADTSDIISVDVISGWSEADGRQMAGLRFRVAQGWKTYWRTPGEAGIPPRFDWRGSENLHAVRVHWPRPEVFDTFGMQTIGYSGEFVLPVELFPKDASRPITARGLADLGVCSDVCIAVSESFEPAPQEDPAAIRQAMDTLPKRLAAGAVTCAVSPIADGMKVTATLSLPDQGGTEVTVIEAGRDDIWVSEPVSTRSGSTLTAVADMVPPEAAPFTLDRSALRITVIGSNGSAEAIGCSAG